MKFVLVVRGLVGAVNAEVGCWLTDPKADVVACDDAPNAEVAAAGVPKADADGATFVEPNADCG